jgi:hypothetical protein
MGSVPEGAQVLRAGGEDQSLYRFRGATVRNILEFTARVPGTKVEKLVTNYRSHKRIVAAYDTWMASSDWANPDGLPFRYDKTISPDPEVKHPNYPSVFCIYAKTEKGEGERFADLVAFLKQSGVIEDYSQVALLLHSVRLEHSGHFLTALEAKGIPAFCPRARSYFENDEVRMMIAALALIFGYHGPGRGQISGGSLARLAKYVDGCLAALGKQYASTPIAAGLRQFVAGISGLKEASPALLHTYERQLCTYAHILEKRYGKRPERLLLYWTAEDSKADALMQFPFTPELVDAAAQDFDSVVRKIKAKNFTIQTLPDKTICKECDIRNFCVAEGTLA